MAGPVRGTEGPVRRTDGPSIVEDAFNCNGSPFDFNCRVRTDLLRHDR